MNANRKFTRKVNGDQVVAAQGPPNEWIFRDYIVQQKPAALNPQWAIWMLQMLYEANRRGKTFNKEFIASFPWAKEAPPMEPPTQGD